MLASLFKKLFGSRNDRLVKQYQQTVKQINALEPATQALSDEELRAKTEAFKQRYANGESLDKLLPEAFAVVREGSKRALGMRHFDVQLIGGMVLNAGKIAEMRTGEGKTLVATLPTYLNALTGKGVHVVTVNDYLAKRDAEWMGQLYNFLGLSVGINLSQMPHDAKQQAYAADITYGTNNEFGFDYLRDNMVFSKEERVQRPLHYALVDEVDSILIDEARTPLIISGQAEHSVDLYGAINEVAKQLVRQQVEDGEGDFWVDEKAQSVTMSEVGHEHAEQLLEQSGLLTAGSSLYEPANITLVHHLYASLRAQNLYHRDQHYVVRNNEIVIVDEFSGRMMPGRRWSDGLHQAVEAKEGVTIQKENQTLASITFQNYFRMYQKLSGMTGTADTEAYEFNQIYALETVVIPTHRPVQRADAMDKVYRTGMEKYKAVIEDIKQCQAKGQPVLVGTTSIENSELISQLLTQAKLDHQVLNAKQHEREATIVAEAGRPGMITIATNMAGRGTDIVLGGNSEGEVHAIRHDASLSDADKETKIAQIKAEWQQRHDAVLAAGGLHIIGTERHESRRVDNQLRGRSGRQGDPGSSRFYLSLEDQLLRIFSGERVAAIMTRLNMPEGEAIEHAMVTRAIENAQRKVEGRNFDIRKQLLEYDDVSNDQRKVIYEQRNELLESVDVGQTIRAMREDVINSLFNTHIPPGSVEEQWDIAALEQALQEELNMPLPVGEWLESNPDLHEETLRERVLNAANESYAGKEAMAGNDNMRNFERAVMLQSLDNHWREHLAALDHLRQGIHLRSYAQKNPKQEYKREAFELFESLLNTVKSEVTKITMQVQVRSREELEAEERRAEEAMRAAEVGNVQYQHTDYDSALTNTGEAAASAQDLPEGVRVGRNDPCPCGSGKRFKNCHGALS
ncbi:preprotein translocase subunit SecA [Methylophilus medardicus]|uniref:Protein translocase subunit SecA n=1 Tax=Methylophilus medardicus TaxID=2588534 RepID=A0A5B8CQE7_9PROT|nr:preprotein translocase subunit SecA [Methylophilus medardicus]QDC43473.1 preprotein translocase subunit SecA [Methylophilus medardicus]QDC48480.1 preprotein translocase subunit SecA [Methylophilus medardicus]QDC52185.1 preprotein translocase subunit SecA [Methylophilus medardicus]